MSSKPFKVRKKGKTRGRPSKAEKCLEAMLEYLWNTNKEAYLDAYKQYLLYGERCGK